MIKHTVYILLFLCSAFANLYAQESERELSVAERNALQGFNDTIDRLADDFVEAYLSVAEPGNYLYTTLGHAAYHMKCPAFDLDYYFSMEGDNVSDAVLRFIAGKLKMGLVGFIPQEYLAVYEKDHRGVTEYKLNLSPVQKQKLWEVLDNNAHKWHNIPYDYFHRSCALSLVDVMNETIGEENIHYPTCWPEKYNHTAGDLVYFQLHESHPWTLSFMRILCGTEADKNIPNERKLICPNDLVEIWQETMVDGKPLLDAEGAVVLPSSGVQKKSIFTPVAFSIILLLLALLSIGTLWIPVEWAKVSGSVIDYVVLSVVTLLGLFLTFLICISHLPCTEWNWLLLVFSPLPAIFWHWRKYWALPYLIGTLLWGVGVLITPYMVAYTEHILLAIAFSIVLLKQYIARTK